MPSAVANRALLAYVKESAYGGSLSATALKRLRFTSEDIQHQPNRAQSAEVRSDRNLGEVMDLSMSAAGPISGELSFTDFETILRAVICAGSGLADTPTSGVTRYKNGTTLDTFYIEKQFLDVAAFTGVYGAVFNELTLTFEANKEVNYVLGILAQKTTKEASSRGLSLTAPSTDAVIRSGVDVAHIKLGGSTIAAAVQRLTLNIRNNITPRGEVTKDAPAEMMGHSFAVSGSMLTYFSSQTLYDDMRANTSRALEVKAGNAAGTFTFQLPAIKLTGGTPAVPGVNGDVMVELPFMAQFGAGADDFTLALDVDPAG